LNWLSAGVEERLSEVDHTLMSDGMFLSYGHDGAFLGCFGVPDEPFLVSHQQLFLFFVEELSLVQLIVFFLDVEEESEELLQFTVHVVDFRALIEEVERAFDGHLFLAISHGVGGEGVFKLAELVYLLLCLFDPIHFVAHLSTGQLQLPLEEHVLLPLVLAGKQFLLHAVHLLL
jgi:hypothetical protein